MPSATTAAEDDFEDELDALLEVLPEESTTELALGDEIAAETGSVPRPQPARIKLATAGMIMRIFVFIKTP
jgi:hypothetical protein